MSQSGTLTGGFGNAPIEAATAFRAAMTALARPGQIEEIAGAAPPEPMSVAAGTLLLTLADPQTPIYLAGGHDTPEIRTWIAFHIGAPVVGRAQAMFAIGAWPALAPLADYAIGTAEYPDRSATLIVEMEGLAAEGATLAGPGIRTRAALSLPDPAAFQANHRLFPLGLDFFLTAGKQIAGLPRSTKISTENAEA